MNTSGNAAFAFSHWYVVHCKPFKEPAVAMALPERLGCQAYLPLVRRLFRGQVRPTPLFPGYVFMQAELHARVVNAVSAIPGALRLLAFGDAPQPVPAAVIDQIRERVDHLNAHGGLPDYPFRQGMPVRIAAGPLQGLEAVFLGPLKPSERVQILIDFLGQLRQAEVHVSMLERAQPQTEARRKRRTRGRGRHIKAG